jgi:hypothetical protein
MGSQEATKSIITTLFKMENACIIYNVMEIHWQRKVIKMKSKDLLALFISQVALALSCKKAFVCLCKLFHLFFMNHYQYV